MCFKEFQNFLFIKHLSFCKHIYIYIVINLREFSKLHPCKFIIILEKLSCALLSFFFFSFFLILLFLRSPHQHYTALQEVTQVLWPNVFKQLPQILSFLKQLVWLHQVILNELANQTRRFAYSKIQRNISMPSN